MTRGYSKWHLLASVVLGLLGGWITRDAWADVHRLAWKDEEASHILLAPVVAIGLLWMRRRQLQGMTPRWLAVGPVTVAAGWVCYSLGDAQLWQAMWHLGAILIVLGCVLTATGIGPVRAAWPAFVALAFLLPVPNRVRQAVAGPLERGAAVVTEHVFELAGASVERSGNVLRINSRDVGIEEACNGMRMMTALLLASYAVAFALPLGASARVLILLLSPVTALVFNILRLVPTVWIYGHSSTGFADTFHEYSGWFMLILAFFTLLSVLRLAHPRPAVQPG